jgi:putative Mg2+ transporter-C (MgtC) family protein
MINVGQTWGRVGRRRTMIGVPVWEIIGRLGLAALLGAVVGLERELAGLPAGLRTHALAALGAAGFGVVSIVAFPGGDPGRVAAGVATGIGFLGAGLILRRDGQHVLGLTTAAGIWSVGATGLAIGTGMYLVGIASALLVGFILASERALMLSKHFQSLRERWMARDVAEDGPERT